MFPGMKRSARLLNKPSCIFPALANSSLWRAGTIHIVGISLHLLPTHNCYGILITFKYICPTVEIRISLHRISNGVGGAREGMVMGKLNKAVMSLLKQWVGAKCLGRFAVSDRNKLRRVTRWSTNWIHSEATLSGSGKLFVWHVGVVLADCCEMRRTGTRGDRTEGRIGGKKQVSMEGRKGSRKKRWKQGITWLAIYV